MKLLRLTRVRVFAMLLAIGLGLTAQLAATAAMASSMAAGGEPEVSAAGMCPGCDGGKTDMGMSAQCGTVFCSNIVAVPASSPILEKLEPEGFVPARYDGSTGLSTRPDPYPPRTTFHC